MLAGRVLIVKQVLLSSLWYFLSIWNGSVKAIMKIKAMFKNYIWSGSKHHSRSGVKWHDWCVGKSIGGINLIDPQKATTILLCK